jgi:chitinase
VTQADYGLYPQFTCLKSKTLETWIAIGGSTFSQPGPMFNAWSNMTQSATNRAVFIQSLMQFFEDWGFQGVDLDWEFPGVPYLGGDSNDTENLVLLVKEMREAFGTKYGISSVL